MLPVLMSVDRHKSDNEQENKQAYSASDIIRCIIISMCNVTPGHGIGRINTNAILFADPSCKKEAKEI